MQLKIGIPLLLGALLISNPASGEESSPGKLQFSTEPTDAELAGARVFSEPLAALNNKQIAGENKALADALSAYASRATHDDCSSLAGFVASFPDSRWTASLLLHTGTEYYNYGYFSKALDAWERSWKEFEGNADPHAKPQADLALGELARMYSRLGRMAELSRLLNSTKQRDLQGPATQLIHGANEALWTMSTKPDFAFGCGPSALDRILLRTDPSKAGNPALLEFRSPTNGFSLSRVAEMSKRLGMDYQRAFRSRGAPFIVPAVVHWKVDHYAALVERDARSGRLLSQDYTFINSVWMTQAALEAEASGYFLVPAGPLPTGWRTVSDEEGQKIWGKGFVIGRNPDGTTKYDNRCRMPPCTNAPSNFPQFTNSVLLDYNRGRGWGGADWGSTIAPVGTRSPAPPPPPRPPAPTPVPPQTMPADIAPVSGWSRGMANYDMHAMLTSLAVDDTPVGYIPPVGPAVEFAASYHQMEAGQPATFTYSNLGQKWTFNWLSFITDSPSSPNGDVSLYVDGGGTLRFSGFNAANQTYTVEAMSQTRLVKLSSASYEMQFPDGSRRQFARSDGSVSSTRRIFLTKVIDPFGNEVTLNYDAQLRLTNIVDAIGQATTLSYTNTVYTNAITAVTDPFGRTAYFEYNASGLLRQITDVIGLTSQFAYTNNQFLNALTTGYGTTTFTTGQTGSGISLVSFVQATDPLGQSERVEWNQGSVLPHSLPTSEVPHGLSTFNLFTDGRNSFYWDKKAYAEGAGDYSKARNYHWLHHTPNNTQAGPILETIKDPLLGRVWFNYPGQPTNWGAPYYLDSAYSGASDQPSVIARVLDDGTTQLTLYEYNSLGKLTKTVDPLGRTFTMIYATNNIDLLEVRMTRAGKNELLFRQTLNAQHLPLTFTDASGQTTTNTYNARGQLISTRNPLGEVTTFTYDANGYVIAINNPGSTNDLTFTMDAIGRIRTLTGTGGYTLTYDYDALDRVTRVTYPDGSHEELVHTLLDATARRDRLGRWTTNTYNANRELIASRDPMGRVTRYAWCECGAPTSVTDPLGRTTSWRYDILGRMVAKQYPDGSTVTYEFENARGLLVRMTDELGQQSVFDYNPDNSLKQVRYPNAIIATPGVSFTYDPDYNRVLTMQDGIGLTTYTYNPITAVPSPGAGALQTISGPLPNSTVAYQYDALGRVVNRTINGVAETQTYDSLGRITSLTNALGLFRYGYVGATLQLAADSYPNGQTNLYIYHNNLSDRRLQRAVNLKPDGSLLSAFGYGYQGDGRIASWTNEWDTLPPRVWNFQYDSVGQLAGAMRVEGATTVASHGYAYDPAGNRTSAIINNTTNGYTYNALNQFVSGDTALPAAVAYEWDAAGRLVAVVQGSLRSEFSYDGMNRRARIVEKTNSTVLADTWFLWCGGEICEARINAGATVTRRFFPQGEVIVGAGTTNLFYTRDHLGSVREVLNAAGVLQSRFDYDPYGRQVVLLAGANPSFGYTGHFQHPPSGLYLTLYRGFDPRIGRWLSRDPWGEAVGLNLYAYVENDPINFVDPTGEFLFVAVPFIIWGPAIAGAVGGFLYAAHDAFYGDDPIAKTPAGAAAVVVVAAGAGAAAGKCLAVAAASEAVAATPYLGPIIIRTADRITTIGGGF